MLLVLARKNPVERISFSSGLHAIEGVLPDGRILYRLTTADYSRSRLLVIRPDGTEVDEYIPFEASVASSDFHKETSESLPQSFSKRFPDRLVDSGKVAPLPPGIYRIAGAVVAQPRPRPPISTTVQDPAKTEGLLLCLNVYQSRRRLLPGSVKYAEFLDGRSQESLGRIPVEADGSFFARLPANRPIKIQLTDGQGGKLGPPSGEMWVRPNENRGCIGCHEERYLTPENRSPLALGQTARDLARSWSSGQSNKN